MTSAAHKQRCGLCSQPPGPVRREIRERAGISQGTMAAALGVSRAALSLAENGNPRSMGVPRLHAWRRITAGLARHLEVSRALSEEGAA